MTRNLARFVACAIVWVSGTSALLVMLLRRQNGVDRLGLAWLVALTVLLTTLESYFAGRDDRRAVRFNLRLRYTMVSAIASVLVTSLWALAFRQNYGAVIALAAGGAMLVVAVVAAVDRARIKGTRPHDLFP
jgi:hypothetical protein